MNPQGEDLRELIDLYLSGRSSDAQVDRLTERLRSDESARNLYVEMADIHAQLATDEMLVAPSVHTKALVVNSIRNRVSGPNVSWAKAAVLVSLAAVLLVALGLGVGRWMDSTSDDSRFANQSVGDPGAVPTIEESDDGVAVLVRVSDARWLDDNPPSAGSILSPGELKLADGLIQVDFYNGVQLLVEGPADLEIRSVGSIVCRQGKLRSHVPPNATGFSVLTPKFELVDLGTEFAIDVASDGRSDVHVFEGEVELYLADGKREPVHRQVLLGGDAIAWSTAGKKTTREAAPEAFASFETIRIREQSASDERFENWRHWNASLRDDPRVVARYDFQSDAMTLNDSSATKAHGTIIGCEWTSGRWAEKGALEFKRPGDRVRVDVPGEFDSLTLSAWVRVDALPPRRQSLLLTDGYEVGRIHWQIGPEGELRIGSRTPIFSRDNTGYASATVFTPRQVGTWSFVCSTYDRTTQTVTHWFNGRRVFTKSLEVDQSVRIGIAEIGNWGLPSIPGRRAIRNFIGRMDELTVWDTALDEREIAGIYEDSKP